MSHAIDWKLIMKFGVCKSIGWKCAEGERKLTLMFIRTAKTWDKELFVVLMHATI